MYNFPKLFKVKCENCRLTVHLVMDEKVLKKELETGVERVVTCPRCGHITQVTFGNIWCQNLVDFLPKPKPFVPKVVEASEEPVEEDMYAEEEEEDELSSEEIAILRDMIRAYKIMMIEEGID